MDLLYFEDFSPGFERRFGARRLSRDEIVAFAREFDPQPFHLDDDAARRSLLGGLSASGWHTLAILMRLYCDEWALRAASMGSPGIEEARWLRPVRPDDVLSAHMRVIDARASRSRPEMGLVTIASEVLNQRGEAVASLRHVNMLGRRGRDWRARAPRQAQPAMASTDPAPAPAQEFATGWFEDATPGARTDLGAQRFEEADMICFARAFDPQYFHVDPEAARQSPFGALAASGWYVACVCMRRIVETRQAAERVAQARGGASAPAGPSPGFRDLRWLIPVFAGDELSFASTIVDKRPTSRLGWGLVFAHNVGVKADGAKAFEFSSAVFCPMRSASRSSVHPNA